jgi:hypothetical protein
MGRGADLLICQIAIAKTGAAAPPDGARAPLESMAVDHSADKAAFRQDLLRIPIRPAPFGDGEEQRRSRMEQRDILARFRTAWNAGRREERNFSKRTLTLLTSPIATVSGLTGY